MPDPFAPASPGDDLSVSAVAWNAALAAGLAHRQPGRPAADPLTRPATGRVEALALNSTGADLQFAQPAAVSAVGGYDPDDTASALSWTRAGLLTLAAPSSTADAVVVALQPIPAGKIGRVAVAGVCLCSVDVGGGTAYARPVPGSTEQLEGRHAGGPVRVLYVPPGSYDSKRCLVLLGGSYAETPDYILSVCPELTAAGCPTGRLWVTWADSEGNTECELTECETCVGEAPPGCGAGGGVDITLSDDAPADPAGGDLWLDTDEEA